MKKKNGNGAADFRACVVRRGVERDRCERITRVEDFDKGVCPIYVYFREPPNERSRHVDGIGVDK